MIMATALAARLLLHEYLPIAAATLKAQRDRAAIAASVNAPTFRGAALEVQTATDHELLLSGPAETGKTYAGLYRLDTLLRETPGATAVIARKVRADMGTTVLRTWDRITALRGGVTVRGGSHPKAYEYPNGSTVYPIGLDRPGKVLSGEFDFVYANQAEELSRDDWETVTTRTTGRGAVTRTPMLFGDCNPGPPSHWILSRPTLRLLHSRHVDNPTLYHEDGTLTEQGERTMRILDALVGVRRERLYFGRWVAAEGIVYEAFDRGLHEIDRFDIPADWRRVRAIDFGYTNPFVCQWWAIDPDGRAFLYREVYRTGRIVEDHARKIVRLSAGERISTSVADHDSEDRATLERHGVPTVAAHKAILPGIQAVQARLRPAGDGRPRLFVFRDALVERDEALAAVKKPCSTAQEFEMYSWAKSADGRPVKEEPVKLFDHGMDAMRYLVAYLDLAPDGDVAASIAGTPAVFANGWGDGAAGLGPGHPGAWA